VVRNNRQFIRELKDLGFELLPDRGDGDHQMWRHPEAKDVTIQIDGKDRDDVHHYNEKQLRDAKRKLSEKGIRGA
jgi:predicted RNA binding protein YcfA (HicA-like mRNA interferase family)